jgi:RNA polymerase sigma factor (sigma-70 family)
VTILIAKRPAGRNNEVKFTDRPAFPGGCRGFLPREVLRHDLPNEKLWNSKGITFPHILAGEKLCYSLAHIFADWAAAQGITNRWASPRFEIPPLVYVPARIEVGRDPLTDDQRRLIADNFDLVDKRIWWFTGKKPLATGKAGHESDRVDDMRSAGVKALVSAAIAYDPAHASDATFRTYATTAIDNAIRPEARRDEAIASLDFEIAEGFTLGDVTPDDQVQALTIPDATLATIRGALTEREYLILQGRLDDRSYTDIADEFGVTRQRISAIEAGATERAIDAVDHSADARTAALARGLIDGQLVHARKMAYRPKRIAWSHWDNVRFKQEWAAQECNPEKRLPRVSAHGAKCGRGDQMIQRCAIRRHRILMSS